MKRSKKLIALVGVLGVVCIATFGVSRYEEQKEIIKNSDEIILELAPDTITAISWRYGEETLAFHKEDAWVYDEDAAFPVDEAKVQTLLELFEEFGVSFVIKDVEDYSQYGLDDPICTITLKTETDTYELQLGDFSTMDSKRYVSLGNGNVYLVNKDPFETFELTLEDMILHDELPDFEAVKEIRFTGAEKYQIIYEEDSQNSYNEKDIYFAKQESGMRPLDTDLVNSYLNMISNLKLDDYVSYKAAEEELERVGLVEPELTVEVQYSHENEHEESVEETFVLHISNDPEMRNEDSDTEADVQAYARIGESPIIYQLTPEQYKQLMAASYDDLRHQEVLAVDFTEVVRLDMHLEDTDYVISTKGDKKDRTYLYGEEELEIETVRNALTSLKAESFTSELPTEKEEISMILYLDGEEEHKIHIGLYRYDGSNCLAVVDGESVSLVARSQVVDLIEAVYGIVLGGTDSQDS